MTNERIAKLTSQLAATPAAHSVLVTPQNTGAQNSVFGAPGVKGPDDVVIVSARRTANTKARKGGFKDTTPDDLLVAVFKAVLDETKIDPALVQDVVIGNAQLSGAYNLPSRTSALRAGIPETCGLRTLNRQCSSGSQAISSLAADIKASYIDIGIAGGVESMTNGGNPGDPSSMPPMNLSEIFENPLAAQCLNPMGITSENVAEKFGITREQQDQLAVDSHTKALAAQAAGKFDKEMVPVKVTVEDAEGNEKEVVISKDEGPRPGTTMEGLAKLKPAFKKGGSTTAGNSSQTSDGAAAVLMMKRSKAQELGLKVLGTFRGSKVVGCPPEIMGIGPAVAIPALLKDTGVSMDQIDVFEINEAFASQATYCVEKLKVPREKLNPNGGAISLGHPLGQSGARMAATLLHELERKGGNNKLGVVSMCVGGGFGFACLMESG